MYAREVKRKCNVRGCRNTVAYAISRTREVGNTVIICKSCLGQALGVIDEIDPKTKSNIPVVHNTSAPALFFNAKAKANTADADDTVFTDNVEDGDTPDAEADITVEDIEGENESDVDADDTKAPKEEQKSAKRTRKKGVKTE